MNDPGRSPAVPGAEMPPAEESASMMTQPGGGGDVTESVTLKRTENGGLIAECVKRGPGDEPSFKSKTYAFASPEEGVAFALQELGGGAPAPEAAPAPGPPMPPGAGY